MTCFTTIPGVKPEDKAAKMARRKTRFEQGIDKMVELAHQ